jgi:hypothetical protein
MDTMILRCIGTAPSPIAAVQQEFAGIPLTENVPVIVHGLVVPSVGLATIGFANRMSGGGLKPPPPSSVEPSGIPTRPTPDTEPIPVGDEADAVGDPTGPLAMAGQVPDAVPAMPPPSKTVLELAELAESALAEQKVARPLAGSSGVTPDVIGLTPGDASSVAPSGMPVGATGALGPMPSGDVMPSGEGAIPPICAEAGAEPSNAAAIATTTIGILGVLMRAPFRRGFGDRRWA